MSMLDFEIVDTVDRLRNDEGSPDGVARDAEKVITHLVEKRDELQSEVNRLLDFARRIGAIVGCGHTENAEDRARLVQCVRQTIAAAPDLLAALERFVLECDSAPGADLAPKMARKAIAKAKGL